MEMVDPIDLGLEIKTGHLASGETPKLIDEGRNRPCELMCAVVQ